MFVMKAAMATNSGKPVCYHRVSTGRQSKSGLGPDAHGSRYPTYLNGGDWDNPTLPPNLLTSCCRA